MLARHIAVMMRLGTERARQAPQLREILQASPTSTAPRAGRAGGRRGGCHGVGVSWMTASLESSSSCKGKAAASENVSKGAAEAPHDVDLAGPGPRHWKKNLPHTERQRREESQMHLQTPGGNRTKPPVKTAASSCHSMCVIHPMSPFCLCK